MKRGKNRGDNLGVGREGMITIEVSVIVPIITFLIVGLVFIMLFFVDMSVVKGETLLITNEVADCWKTDADLATGDYRDKNLLDRDINFLIKNKRSNMVKKAEKRLVKRLRERLILTTITQKSIQIRSGKVIAKVTVRFLWPHEGVASYMGTDSLSFSCRSVSAVYDQEERLRKMKSKKIQNEVRK